MGFFLWVPVMLFFFRSCVLVMWSLGLSACQVSQGPDGLLADPDTRVFNFDWRLSGDSQVGPLQVFDNGIRTWLHFAPEQILPAVFGRRDGQETLLPLRPSGQFQLIDGLWAELLFRAGRAQAQASQSLKQGGSSNEEGESGLLPAREQGKGETPAELTQKPTFQATSNLLPAHASALGDQPPEIPVFELRLKDKTLRQALIRWARQAKWVFDSEHWTLDVDFPIKAAARFEGGFESAVAQLLAAAQLNAHPLQACFYSNQVLRVLAGPQVCDPGTQTQEGV